MLDNDNLTYSVKSRSTFANRQSERALITVDRSQKLDLLIHLLTNLQQSLIVCGPEGIGKTTLLKALQDSHKDIWPICLLPGSSALSFESVVNQLSRFLNLSNASVTFDLSSLRAYCDKQKVVLMIDDAGELMPGLVGELMDFADSLAGLRLVFAMNNDALQAKSGSDGAIEACHFIELPPLNQRQCLEFLQNQSAQPGFPLSFGDITDSLVEDMYRQTQGIPGKLLSELPSLRDYQSRQTQKAGLWIVSIALIASVVFAAKTLLPWPALNESGVAGPVETAQTDPEQARAEPPQLEPESAPLVSDNMTPASELLPAPLLTGVLPTTSEMPPAQTEAPVAADGQWETGRASAPEIAPTDKAAETVEPAPQAAPFETPAPAAAELPAKTAGTGAEPDKPKTEPKPVEKKTVEKPAPMVTPKPASPKPDSTGANSGDAEWIQAQPGSHYTVQVMVLSSEASVNRFMRKYADYAESLKYYPAGKAGQEKYVIIYGSFPTAIEALNTKSDMPGDFAGGLVKRFKQVQRESRRR